MTPEQARLADRVEAWVNSPQGARALIETRVRIIAAEKEFREMVRIDPETLRKTMTTAKP